LNAEPFDPQALAEVFAEARSMHQAMEDNMAAAFVDAASKISPEGRAKLAAQRGHGAFMRRRMERRGGPPPDGPPPHDGMGPPPPPPPPR